MLDWIAAGGWMMLPIILVGLIAIAIIIERFWYLRTNHILPEGLLEQALGIINNPPAIIDWKAQVNHLPLGYILSEGLEATDLDQYVLQERLEAAGRHALLAMERYLSLLGSIASISPLLGLLGTVFGMIKTFMVLGGGEPATATALAGGISEALLTTAAGLLVAIPALMIHRHFQRRVDILSALLEQQARLFVEHVLEEHMEESYADEDEGERW